MLGAARFCQRAPALLLLVALSLLAPSASFAPSSCSISSFTARRQCLSSRAVEGPSSRTAAEVQRRGRTVMRAERGDASRSHSPMQEVRLEQMAPEQPEKLSPSPASVPRRKQVPTIPARACAARSPRQLAAGCGRAAAALTLPLDPLTNSSPPQQRRKSSPRGSRIAPGATTGGARDSEPAAAAVAAPPASTDAATAPPGVGGGVGMGAVQMDALRRALDAHLASRGSCRVSPEEALWVEAALERQEETFFADQGFQIPEYERAAIHKEGGNPTYGELLPSGVDALLHIMGLDERASFFDLGCGTGRALLHVAAAEARLGAAVGVEMSATRLEYGRAALAELRREAAAEGRALAPVEFVQGNIEHVDVSGCTHAFMSSVCFDDRVLRAVSEKLAAAPGFRLLVTLRSIPLQPHLRPLGAVRLANTFHGSHPAFLYVKNTPQGLADAPPGPPAPRPPRAPVHPPSSSRVALRPCARAAAEAAGRARAAEALAAIMCHDGACWLPPHLQESSESLLVAEP